MRCYKVTKERVFKKDSFSIEPIRDEDRYAIMKWRNEQMYHLRQNEPLTEQTQDQYFSNVVERLFHVDYPEQLLYSYLEGEKCIGYGGLVHINWAHSNAEISFIMDTTREQSEFIKHWGVFLQLIEQVAFQQLHLHKIYTYAFDLRPKLYEALELNAYRRDALLRDHCKISGTYRDVIIHSKLNAE